MSYAQCKALKRKHFNLFAKRRDVQKNGARSVQINISSPIVCQWNSNFIIK